MIDMGAFDVISSQSVKEHGLFYFFDGNIVLSGKKSTPSASNSAGVESPLTDTSPVSVLFRVHKSICAVHSPIFAGLLDDASESVSEVYDGVPLVEMPDTADEIEAMLKVMYGLSEWKKYSGKKDPNFPLLVTNLMAMATKYEMEDVRLAIIEAMHCDWPFTLDEWDALHPHVGDLEDFQEEKCSRKDRLPEPAAAAIFARRFDIPELRAVALHTLSRTDTRQQWGDEGTPLDLSARWNLLDRDDYRALNLVLELQRDLRLVNVLFDHQDCEESCLPSHADKANGQTGYVSAVRQSRDALTALQSFEERMLLSDEFAGGCTFFTNAASNIDDVRRRYWSGLLNIARGDKAYL